MTDPFSASPPSESLRPFSVEVRQFPVFVSYGDDAMALKVKVKRLVEEALNRQLSHGAWATQLIVWDWRDIAARRAPAGGRTNDIFVEKVRASSVTSCFSSTAFLPVPRRSCSRRSTRRKWT
jgi:hypothetical protein